MQLDDPTLKSLDLKTSITNASSQSLDHLPPLIGDRCLRDAPSDVARYLRAVFQSGHSPESETITMPKRGHGPRPVRILESTSRALYDALVERIRPDCPAPTRGPGKWATFQAFGLPSSTYTAKYVVSFDVAACYEYIDHAKLLTELVAQAIEPQIVVTLTNFLTELAGENRGLPQMSSSSDLLADIYLGAIERHLVRCGYAVLRYADDFKVLAGTWGSATGAVEEAAQIARDLGLVLSTQKTDIRLAKALAENQERLDVFLETHFEKAKDDLTGFDYIRGDYGEWEEITILPEKAEALEHAFRKILEDYAARSPDSEPLHAQFVGKAIGALQESEVRISDKTLETVAFRQPVRLEAVCRYISSRDEPSQNWRTLARLAKLERQTAWSKIWLLDTADHVPATDGNHQQKFIKWARRELKNGHEIVRAQAGWFLARTSQMSGAEFTSLFSSATQLTRPGLAAALARQGEPNTTPLARAVVGSSRLAAKGFEWGAAQ